jgi:hypothetical protein
MKGTISQNDGIDDVATLYASPRSALQLAGAVHQIKADIAHHQAAAPGAD